MKAKFIGDIPERSGALLDSKPWIELGEICVVLAVNFMYAGEVVFRIYSEKQKTPILMNSKSFHVVDGRVPAEWVLSELPGGVGYALSAPAFLDPRFWDAFFDQDEDARSQFLKEYQRITGNL